MLSFILQQSIHSRFHMIQNSRLPSIFVKVAEALGVKGIRVTKKEEMGPAIREAIASGKPALIDVWIDCDEKVFPMVPAGAPIEDVFDAEDLAKKEQEKN